MDKKANGKMREIGEMRNILNAFKRRHDYLGSLPEKTKNEVKEFEMLRGDMHEIRNKLLIFGEEK